MIWLGHWIKLLLKPSFSLNLQLYKPTIFLYYLSQFELCLCDSESNIPYWCSNIYWAPTLCLELYKMLLCVLFSPNSMVTWQGRHNIPIFQLKKTSSSTEVACGRARVLTPGPPDSRAQAYSVFRIFSYGTTESSTTSRGGGRAECEGSSELWADRIAEAKMRALCGICCGFRWPGLFRALMWQAVLSDTMCPPHLWSGHRLL